VWTVLGDDGLSGSCFMMDRSGLSPIIFLSEIPLILDDPLLHIEYILFSTPSSLQHLRAVTLDVVFRSSLDLLENRVKRFCPLSRLPHSIFLTSV